MNQQQQMMRQIAQMQAGMAKAQEEIAAAEVSATAGGGSITVVASGLGLIKSIKIDPAAVDPDDVEMLEDLVVAAVNEAGRKVDDAMKSSLGGMLGGMGLPGM